MTFIPNVSGFVSTVNSSVTPLGIGNTFTGVAEDVSKYATVTVMCFSNVGSSPTGLQVQFSSDGTNWDVIASVTYLATTKFTLERIIPAKFCRVVFINNSSTAQTTFRLQLLYHISKQALDSPQTITFNPEVLDAFGRLRVSAPATMIEISYTVDKNTYYDTELVSGAGTALLTANEPSVTMSVTSGTDSIIKQSRQRGIYQPGKSLLILSTGVLNLSGANGVGVTSSLGYFDDKNGHFFSHVGNGGVGTLYINERSSCTGTTVTTSISQSAWNFDKLDGTGISGITINSSKAIIFVIDLEWLGTGLVRFGVIIGGKTLYCHYYYHSNLITSPYSQSASLPLRARISTTSGAGTMKKICSTAISEGGFSTGGRIFSYSRPIGSTITVNAITPVVSFRLKSSGIFPLVNAVPIKLSLVSTANVIVIWYLVMFRDIATASVLTGSSFTSVNPNSAVEYDISATSVIPTFPNYNNSNIIVIASGTLTQTSDTINGLTLPTQGNNPSILTTNLSGVPDVLSIIAHSTGNTNMFGGLTFSELY